MCQPFSLKPIDFFLTLHYNQKQFKIIGKGERHEKEQHPCYVFDGDVHVYHVHVL